MSSTTPLTSAPQPTSNTPRSTFRLYMQASHTFPWPSDLAPSRSAAATWSSRDSHIASALSRLPTHEQASVMRFFHAADSSRSLGALYLKHLAIMRGAGVPWSQSTISQERDVRNGKPYYEFPDSDGELDFNVSHHGEYVVCVGSSEAGVSVGIDVVQIDLKRDGPRIRQDGFAAWLDVFSDILSPAQKAMVLAAEREDGTRAGLRCFYSVWACKEAYVKMTSDALMAPFLQSLAFPGMSVPVAVNEDGESAGIGTWGLPVVTQVEIEGRPVEGVRIELLSLGKDYIVATAINRGVELPDFELVSVNADASRMESQTRRAGELGMVTYSLE